MSDNTDHEIHQHAGLGARLEPGVRPAVVVVDLTLAFTDPECPLGADATDQVLSTRRLLDVARARGVPIYFTAISYEAGLADAGLWPEKLPGLRHLEAGTRWASTAPRDDVDPRLG